MNELELLKLQIQRYNESNDRIMIDLNRRINIIEDKLRELDESNNTHFKRL